MRLLRGVNPHDVNWPLHRSAAEPLFAHPDGSSLSSSGKKKGVNMLRRVRAVAAALKFRGHPDLLNTDIRTMQNYWLKITGDSEMHTRNVKPHMINGQGRWRLHAQDPPDMVFKYCQSKLQEKLETSNF